MSINQISNNNINFKGLSIGVKNKGSVYPGIVTTLEENIKRRFLKNAKEIGVHVFDENDIYIEKQGKNFQVTTTLPVQNKLLQCVIPFNRAKNERFDKFAKRLIKNVDEFLTWEKNKYNSPIALFAVSDRKYTWH